MIWTDAQLNQWSTDAEQAINVDLQCIFQRAYLNVTTGQSVYTLPSFVRTLSRISWRGRRLDAVNWEEMTWLTPATVFVATGSSANIETSQSRPLYYAFHPTNPYDIRLYPTPNETFGQGPDPYSPDVGPYCIIAYWRSIDSTFQDLTAVLPKYIDRRTRKAYVLYRAFSCEGPGQNLKMADYYKNRYNFLIDQFRAINNFAYLSKRYTIEDGNLEIDGFRYPKPILPSNFEITIF